MKPRTVSRTGTLGHERMKIQEHATMEAMYKFLNSQYDGRWREYDGPLGRGVYAFVGGQWQNVKHLDPSILPHV